jgi:beta-glucosidase
MPDALVAEAQLAAHRRAREVLASVDGLRSGWTVATQAFEPSGEPGSTVMVEQYGRPREGWYLEAAAGDDFVGVQAYTRTIVGPDGPRAVGEEVARTLTGWEVFPEALERGVRRAAALAPGVPILVTENGIATDDDEERITYTERALRGLADALADGIDVRGYLHWSALDNYEWAAGYRPTFGLIAVDRATFVRTPKPSLAWLGSVAVANGLRPA